MYFKKNNMPEKGSVYRAKLTSVIYGIVCIAVAFGTEYFGSVLQASLTIFSVVGGPILGLFTVGMFFPFANQTASIYLIVFSKFHTVFYYYFSFLFFFQGALVGFISSLAFSLFLGFWPTKPALKRLPVYTDGCIASLANCTYITPSSPQTK